MKTQQIETEHYGNLLDNFKKILDYGNSKMQTISLDWTKVRLKKHVLYFMMCAMQSYSESILKLMNPPSIYDKAAEVILRSLVELFINLNFVYACKTRRNALIFIVDSVQDKAEFARKYKRFMQKRPNWKLDFANITKATDWDPFILKLEDEIKDGEKKFGIRFPNKIPDIRGRAITADNYLETKNKLTKKKSLEFYYVAYYKFFSQIAHLTMPGLERFLTEDENGNRKLNIDGSPEDIERVVSVTYQFYYVTLRFFLKEFKAFRKQEFELFDKTSKNLIQ